jgi:hypothetical protein
MSTINYSGILLTARKGATVVGDITHLSIAQADSYLQADSRVVFIALLRKDQAAWIASVEKHLPLVTYNETTYLISWGISAADGARNKRLQMLHDLVCQEANTLQDKYQRRFITMYTEDLDTQGPAFLETIPGTDKSLWDLNKSRNSIGQEKSKYQREVSAMKKPMKLTQESAMKKPMKLTQDAFVQSLSRDKVHIYPKASTIICPKVSNGVLFDFC